MRACLPMLPACFFLPNTDPCDLLALISPLQLLSPTSAPCWSTLGKLCPVSGLLSPPPLSQATSTEAVAQGH